MNNTPYPSENAKTTQEFKDFHYQRLLEEDRLVTSALGLSRVWGEGTDDERRDSCAFTIDLFGHYLLIKEDYTNEPARYGVILVTGVEADAETVGDYTVGPLSGSEVIRYLLPTALFTDAERLLYRSLYEVEASASAAQTQSGEDSDEDDKKAVEVKL